MALNYAKGQPVGNNQVPFYDSPPAVIALATGERDVATVSSITILNANTTAIEVGTSGGPAFIKWLTQAVVDSSVAGTSVISSGATSNFDGMVASNTVRRFIIPIASQRSYPAATGNVAANRENGLYPNVAISGRGSVFTIQN